jgi:hypothetical protein
MDALAFGEMRPTARRFVCSDRSIMLVLCVVLDERVLRLIKKILLRGEAEAEAAVGHGSMTANLPSTQSS